MDVVPIYISSNSFSIEGDLTEDFLPKMAIRLQCEEDWIYTTIVSSTFSNNSTEIVVRTFSLTDPITAVELSYIAPKALPEHSHLNYATGGPDVYGQPPDHEWVDTKLRFRRPDGEWGALVDLLGDKLQWRGPWSENVEEYFINDVVLYEGSAYIAINDSIPDISSPPDVSFSDWDILAQKGNKGDRGEDFGILQNCCLVGGESLLTLKKVLGTPGIIKINEQNIPLEPFYQFLFNEGANGDLYPLTIGRENITYENRVINESLVPIIYYVYLTNSNSLWTFNQTRDFRNSLIINENAPETNDHLSLIGDGLNAKYVGYIVLNHGEEETIGPLNVVSAYNPEPAYKNITKEYETVLIEEPYTKIPVFTKNLIIDPNYVYIISGQISFQAEQLFGEDIETATIGVSISRPEEDNIVYTKQTIRPLDISTAYVHCIYSSDVAAFDRIILEADCSLASKVYYVHEVGLSYLNILRVPKQFASSYQTPTFPE